MASNDFETEYWNCVAPYKSKYEFIKLHLLMDVTETLKMLQKAKDQGEINVVLDVMSKKADPNKFYAKRSIRTNKDYDAKKAHLPRAEAKEDLPF
jgi:hypothetical protein|tara:strand:- start:1544 stop:1828 length:285 start_codon:yes stop_codon:yes gene_type:complete